MLKHVVRGLCLALAAGLSLSLTAVPASASQPPEPAGPARSDQLVRNVPLVVAHYDSGLYPANVSSGFQEQCAAQVYYRWPEIHGYEADHLIYTRLASRAYELLDPPFGDKNLSGAVYGGDFTLPPGMHQFLGSGNYSVTNGPPGVYKDCRAEADEYRAQYSATAEVTYVRSAACVAAQDKVAKAEDKVKAAKKAVNQATTDDAKAKAKKKLKKAKKKLKKAEERAEQSC